MTAIISKALYDEIKREYDILLPKVITNMREIYRSHYNRAGHTLTEEQLDHLIEKTLNSGS